MTVDEQDQRAAEQVSKAVDALNAAIHAATARGIFVELARHATTENRSDLYRVGTMELRRRIAPGLIQPS